MIGFEARISGPSLEPDFFVSHPAGHTELRIEACYALPKNIRDVTICVWVKLSGGKKFL